MASTAELVEAIYRLIASSPTPIPITLMNHGVDETAAIIGAIVERFGAEPDERGPWAAGGRAGGRSRLVREAALEPRQARRPPALDLLWVF
jgi:hypothetical protein